MKKLDWRILSFSKCLELEVKTLLFYFNAVGFPCNSCADLFTISCV